MDTGINTTGTTEKMLPTFKNPFIRKQIINLRNAGREVVILHAEACAMGFKMLNGEVPEAGMIENVSLRLKAVEEHYKATQAALLRLNIDISAIAQLSARERLDLFSHYFTLYTPSVPDAVELFSPEELKALVATIL